MCLKTFLTGLHCTESDLRQVLTETWKLRKKKKKKKTDNFIKRNFQGDLSFKDGSLLASEKSSIMFKWKSVSAFGHDSIHKRNHFRIESNLENFFENKIYEIKLTSKDSSPKKLPIKYRTNQN
jgi:hypothetical protein